MDFRTELETLINKYSLENGSDTPDFILVNFIIGAIKSFDDAVIKREEWYGRSESIEQF